MSLIYHITTEKGTYNHVIGRNHFQDVRDNHEDYTPIIKMSIWSRARGQWISTSPRNW